MDGGQVIALISVVATVVLAVLGGVFKYLLGRIRDLTTSLEVAGKTIENKSETITVLQRQVDKYEITADLQEKFFGSLPPRKPSGDR
jgi:hypothetical protein